MPVFFIKATDVKDGLVVVRGELFQHLVKSLRTRPGESLIFNDEQGTRHRTSVQEITREFLVARVEFTETHSTSPPYPLIIGQAILKGDKMNWVIQKATELGVGTIVPLQTERVISKSSHPHNTNLERRWSRIALEAAQQNERWAPPRIESIASFPRFIETYSAIPTKFILAERAEGLRLSQQTLPSTPDSPIVMAIGPEGGWTPEELRAAEAAKFSFTTLGSHILRAETASLAGLAILQTRLGWL